MSRVGDYRNVEVSVEMDGFFTATANGVPIRQETYKGIMKAIDKTLKKTFQGFEAWDASNPERLRKVQVVNEEVGNLFVIWVASLQGDTRPRQVSKNQLFRCTKENDIGAGKYMMLVDQIDEHLEAIEELEEKMEVIKKAMTTLSAEKKVK